MTWLLANWRLVLIGLLALGLGVQTVRLAWLQAEVASDKAAQADAILALEKKAEALSNELVIEQARAMGVTAQKGVVYVDRVKTIPVAPGEDEAARSDRMRAGSVGVRDIVCGLSPAPAFCKPAAR